MVLALPDESLPLLEGTAVVFCAEAYNGFCFQLPALLPGGTGFVLPTGVRCSLDQVIAVRPQAVHPHWYEVLNQVLSAWVTHIGVDDAGQVDLVGYEDEAAARAAGYSGPRLDWQALCPPLIYGPLLPEHHARLDRQNGNRIYVFERVPVHYLNPVPGSSPPCYEPGEAQTLIALACPHCTNF